MVGSVGGSGSGALSSGQSATANGGGHAASTSAPRAGCGARRPSSSCPPSAPRSTRSSPTTRSTCRICVSPPTGCSTARTSARRSRCTQWPGASRSSWPSTSAATTDADATAGAVAAALRAHRTGGESHRHLTLEEWAPTSRSLIWRFNALYWQHLQAWEEATGRGYESALPGGQSDAREDEPVRATIRELFAVWDALAQRHALPEELYVVELGVGNGNQARTWLDAFRELDAAGGRRYYRRLHYLMGDYSPHVLELARAAVRDHAEHVSSLVLDALRPIDGAGIPAVQGVPGLHLQRLRQPAHRRDRDDRAARAPRPDPRLPRRRRRAGDRRDRRDQPGHARRR